MSNFEHKQRAHNIFSKIIIIILYYNNFIENLDIKLMLIEFIPE